MNKAKSQVTMLIIFGLVLFIAVSLVIYFSKSSIKRQSSQSIKKIQETTIDTQPIKEFVTKCLDKLSKDALILIGKQGGYIYASQGGTLVDYQNTDEGKFFARNGDSNVAYNIKMPSYNIFPYTSEIPDYPWAMFPYKDSNKESFEGIFGMDNIPPLTPSGGPHSIQTQIETFVDNNMPKCADFSFFKKQGFDIFMNSSKTSVIIGSSDISVKSKIPITINNPTTKKFAEIIDFSTNIDTRLRDIYYFTKELIDYDIENIKFNINDAGNNRDSLSVRLVKDVYSNDDLVVVSDEKSLIYGKPFEYAFARKNRAPALYYLRKSTLEFEQNHMITEADLLQGNELKAEDPDEDSYRFTIKSLSSNPELPTRLDRPQIKFRIEVSDRELSDYQDITVKRLPIT